ncbi:MAG: NAD(P)-binding domain-containing protein [Anaerolineaceae bacterium]|nr:NAD(P)-binding domain-containing protein [Anaerolineaceae bacterium]
MTMIYTEVHGDLSYLDGKTVAIIGYGSLGRSVALNLRDSGLNVLVSETDLERVTTLQEAGFQLVTISEAVQKAQVIILLVPNETMPGIYLDQISPQLRRGHMLIFASAYNLTFGFIEPPPFVDVGLIAPRILGPAVRERFTAGEGFYSFISVAQDSSGQSWPLLLALAKALGTLRAGAIEIAFQWEAELDLFVQQTILPLMHLVFTTAANLLINKGYTPEAALTELYLSGEINDYLERATQSGLLQALLLAPLTNQYGTFSRVNRFSDLKLERLMEVTLDEIKEGNFAREWSKEYADGYNRLKKLIKEQQTMELWELEKQALEMFGQNIES